MSDATPLDVGALTEWDPLDEVIVGGFEAQYPVLTERELSLLEASLPRAEIDDIKQMQGRNLERDDPERFARARQEVMDLKAVFESLGVVVHLPRSLSEADVSLFGSDSGLLSWFPRDMFITHKNKIMFASLGMPMHQKAQQLYYEIMNDQANSSDRTSMIAVPIPNFGVKEGAKTHNRVPQLDGGDVLFFGDKLFVGISEQKSMGSNARGVYWLQMVLGPDYEVIAVPLHERYFHLDLVMSAPREGLIMVAPEAYIDGIPNYFDDWDRIEVTGDQAMTGCLNGLPVDPGNYVLGNNHRDHMDWMASRVEDKGVTVHMVWFDEHNRKDGSIRCATQQLRRVPG